VLVLGCSERDRPITPTGAGGSGSTGPIIPVVTISAPGRDTIVPPDQTLLIRGDVVDDFGVDSIFIDIQGAPFTFAGSNVDGPLVLWSFTLSTTGLADSVLTISVTAKDEDGNVGGPAVRVLSVQ
jgi:hypothetical protein